MKTRNVVLFAGSAVALLSYAAAISGLTRLSPPNTDFAAHYGAALVWRTGGDVYSSSQGIAALNAIGVHRQIDTPPGWAPGGIAMVLPFTLLGFTTALPLWIAINVLALGGGLTICARIEAFRARQLRLPLITLGGPYLLFMVWEAQADGILSLFTALAARAWINDRKARAATWLIPLLAVKPHLALGLAAFALGSTSIASLRRLLPLAAAGTAVLVLLLRPETVVQWWHAVQYDAVRWPAQNMPDITGLVASAMGTQFVWLGMVVSVAVVAAALLVGIRYRNKPIPPAILVMVTVASLLAAPHLYIYDLALLAPVLLSWLRAEKDAPRTLGLGVGLWSLMTLVSLRDEWPPGHFIIDPAFGLLAVMVVAAAMQSRRGQALRPAI